MELLAQSWALAKLSLTERKRFSFLTTTVTISKGLEGLHHCQGWLNTISHFPHCHTLEWVKMSKRILTIALILRLVSFRVSWCHVLLAHEEVAPGWLGRFIGKRKQCWKAGSMNDILDHFLLLFLRVFRIV